MVQRERIRELERLIEEIRGHDDLTRPIAELEDTVDGIAGARQKWEHAYEHVRR